MKRQAGVLLAWMALGSAVAAQLADFDERREAARIALLAELEGYVEWCRANNLFAERKRALELVLELEPDHAGARKLLGHTRDKAGNWAPPSRPKSFRDFEGPAREEAPARFAALRSGYLDAMLALLDEPGLAPAQRQALAADVLRLDPENQRVHGLLGEVKSDKGWVLPETVRAAMRREELRALVRTGLESAPPARPCELSEREGRFELPFRAVATPAVRVVGTVEEQELLRMAQALHALEHLLRGALDMKGGLPAGCTVFLLADPAQKGAFLEHHPAIRPAERALYEPLEGAGIQGTSDFVFWTGDSQRRIDGIVRLVLGYLLTGAFEVTVEHGWAYEGFGIFLTRSLVRTRMTWLAQPDELSGKGDGFELRQRLIDPETNWVDEGYQLLTGGRAPPLAELFEKSAHQLTTEDVLLAYTLATYLLEAQADKTPVLLGKLGRGLPGARALSEGLGMEPEDFQRHLCRWLSERR